MQQLHLVIPQFSFDMPFPSQIRMSRDSTALESIILDGFYAFYGTPLTLVQRSNFGSLACE